MKEVMPQVWAALRASLSCVPRNEVIYLVMNNAGCHGTDEAVQQYTKKLRDDYNVKIVQQVPRSPETNLLDLGIWRSIQAAVEKAHVFKCSDADALARTVESVWANHLSATVFERVYSRLLIVMDIIFEDNGDNKRVESKRGKRFFTDPVYALDEDDPGEDQGQQEEDLVERGWI